MVCACLDGILSLFRVPRDHESERADFERTVQFLTSVPLFRKQLPRSELPKVAQCLTRRTWAPGQRLVRQGEPGRAFFLIQSGEALVMTGAAGDDGGEQECVRARLCAGDYFGGHTLITERPNVATIVAGGPPTLVTLSMSRTAFEESGLKRWLHFPKRPAIYEDIGRDGAGRMSSVPEDGAVSAVEEEFIRTAVGRNVNIRALLSEKTDKLAAIAARAERRTVAKGAILARCGDVGNEFFIIREGSIEVDLTQNTAACGQMSAEAAVAASTMADRLLRKQTFLQNLNNSKPVNTKAVSVAITNSPADGKSWGAIQKQRTSDKMSFALTAGAGREANRKKQPRQVSMGSADLDSMRGDSTKSFGRTPNNASGSEVSDLGNSPMKDCAPERLTLKEGDSFGELSLLYNTRREATFRAVQDSVLYVVGRRHFKEGFSRKGSRFKEYCELLEEVRMLTPLLSSERFELACSASGFIDFPPGHRILRQGKERQAKMWYIVSSGSAVMVREDPGEDGELVRREIAQVRRAGTFGERSLLRGEPPEVSVEAGPEGLCCLTFDFYSIRFLIEGVLKEGDGSMPTVCCEIDDWCAWKAHGGWERQVSSASSRIGSAEGRNVDLHSLTKICLLGRGGYGQVTLVQDTDTQQRYALKTMSKGYIQSQGAERLVLWERELLSMVRSPFVIRLHNTFTDEQCIYFLLEAALGGALIDVLRSHPEVLAGDTPRGSAAAFYVACLTAALEHLHERKIVHRDIKPENALLDERGYAKLCDMGFARFVLGKTNTLAGTPEYMAPEMIDFPHTHDTAVDWWALGVVTYEMLSGQTPFEDEGIAEPMGRLLALRRSQEKGTPSFPFHFPPVAKGFVSSLLQKLPNRLGVARGAVEIREHRMFAVLKFDFETFNDGLLPSPFTQEWSDQAYWATDDLGMDRGDLGLSEGDPLFVQATRKLSGFDY